MHPPSDRLRDLPRAAFGAMMRRILPCAHLAGFGHFFSPWFVLLLAIRLIGTVVSAVGRTSIGSRRALRGRRIRSVVFLGHQARPNTYSLRVRTMIA